MRIERLTAAHPVTTFTCGNQSLDLWLHHAALDADRSGTARVYVTLTDDHQIGGYFALLPHDVRRLDIPLGIGRGAPDLIPCYLLARLALAQHLHGSGRGSELLVIGLTKILEAIRVGGGRLIVVDAINPRAADFYRHHGFKPIPTDPSRLVMKARTAARSIGVDWP